MIPLSSKRPSRVLLAFARRKIEVQDLISMHASLAALQTCQHLGEASHA